MGSARWGGADLNGQGIMGSSIFILFGGFLFILLPIDLHGYFTESFHRPLIMSIMFILFSLSIGTLIVGGIIYIKEIIQTKKHRIFILQTSIGIWLWVGAGLTLLIPWKYGIEFIPPMLYIGLASLIAYVVMSRVSKKMQSTEAVKELEEYNKQWKMTADSKGRYGAFRLTDNSERNGIFKNL